MTVLSNPNKARARSKPDETRNAKTRKQARRPRPRKPAISKREPESVKHIGIGIDTGRYGHHVSFMHEDKQKAAESITVMENTEDYSILRDQLFEFCMQFPHVHLHVRIDAAGQYATNLEVFLREIQGLPITISVGEPKRNKDYHSAHAPKSQNDATESRAMARYAVIEKPTDTHGVPLELITLRRIASRLQATTKQTTRLINQFHETLSSAFSEFATIQDNISSAWVLILFSKYPTAERIGKAKLSCNPEVRALFLRRVAAGDSKQVAWGYCMTKLLRQIFGVWVTDTDFDRNFGAHGEAPTDEQVLEDIELAAEEETETESLGHTQDVGQVNTSKASDTTSEKVVTRNPASLEPVKTETIETVPSDVTSPAPPSQTNSLKNNRVSIDYAELRTKIHLASVLQLMGCVIDLGKSQQRLPCPLHGPGGRSKKTFSVNLKRNVFRCFDSNCGCQGNALDLYVAYTGKPLYEASIELTQRLGIELPKRPKTNSKPSKRKEKKSGGHTPPSP